MRLLLFVAILCSCITVQASTYYFSSTIGNDSYSTAEAQNAATPWRTLQKLNSFSGTYKPGDSILFKSGDLFYGSINISRSGSPSQPIVFSSFGGQQKPIISGFSHLESWFSKGSNIWETKHGIKSSRINTMLINGVSQQIGRYPNRNATSSGYLFIDNAIGNIQITDFQLSSAPNFTGGEVVIRKNRWITDRNLITNHNGSNISYTSESGYPAYNKYGYFIQNHPATLDQVGEWFSNVESGTIGLLWPGDPKNANVEISSVENLVTSNGFSFIEFHNLNFKGANNYAFKINETQQFKIQNCEILFSGVDAINASGCNNITVENCVIDHSNNNGIAGQGCSNFIIRSNKIKNTGMVAGAGKGGDGNYEAIVIDGDNELIELNTIDSTGYIPITFRGNENIVRNNFINNFTLVKDDGGGIYTWNNIPGIINHGNKIIGNVVLNGKGAGDGTDHPDYLAANGIYMDDGTANAEIIGNTVAFCGLQSLYIHNAHEVKIKDNTFFDSRKQMSIIRDNFAPQSPVRNLDFKNNIVFSKESHQLIAEFWTDFDDITEFGDFDDNYYCRPLDDKAVISANYRRNGANNNKQLTLEEWQANFGKDKNSKKSPLKLTSTDFIRFEYNATSSSKTIKLDAEYIDVKNNKYSGAVTIDPYSSIILLQTTGLGDTIVPESTCPGLGGISREQWDNVGGTSVAEIPLHKVANTKSVLTSFEGPVNIADNYGTRIRGFICPPVTGSYRFMISGDDNCELWLSTDESPEKRVKIAYVSDWTNPREWAKYPSQKSEKILLVEGRKYYIEALHKEGGGGDNLSVGWQFPNGVIEAPIEGKRLSPFTSTEVLKGVQSINFSPIPSKVVGDAPFELYASASSGLPVNYTVASGPATLSGNVVRIVGVGDVEIIASQPGNEHYSAAPSASQRFSVKSGPIIKTSQTITFEPISNKILGDAPFMISGTSTSNLQVNFRIASGPAKIDGNIVTITGLGIITIEASQSGNDQYNAATSVTQAFNVSEGLVASGCTATGKIVREIWEELKGSNIADIPLTQKPKKTTDISLFESQADIDDNYGLRIRGYICPPLTGNYTFFIAGDELGELYLSNSANANDRNKIAYFSARTGRREWTKFASQKSILIYLEAGKRYYIEALMKEQIGDDHLSVAWQLPNGIMEAPIAGSRLSPYTGTEEVKAFQSISFQPIPAKKLTDAPFMVQASASSGLPVSFQVTAGSATISNNLVTVTGVGLVEITASQVGNSNYQPATSIKQQFEVINSPSAKQNQSITFNAISAKTLGNGPFEIHASSSAGLSVNFRVLSGAATVTGNVVTVLGIGTVVIQASQAGNENYFAATVVEQSFIVKAAELSTICSATGKMSREIWEFAKGQHVNDIPLLLKPTKTDEVNLFESRRDIDDNYGLRLRGYICPPLSGNYIFWVSGDETGELYLGSNDLPSSNQPIASFSKPTGYRQWDKYASQKSIAIYLEAGKRYYIEALMKEQIGEDHLSVAWQLPNGIVEAPIPGIRLSPFESNAALRVEAPGFMEANMPLNTSVSETMTGHLKVFPNPVTAMSNVMVSVVETGAAAVEVLDVYGKRIQTLFNGNIEAIQPKRLELKASALSPGVYLIRLTTKTKVYTQKIVVIK